MAVVKKGKIFSRMIVVFVSGSLDFLTILSREINVLLHLKINKVYKGSSAYRLAYSTGDSVKIFKYIYKDAEGRFLRRKFGVFKTFFKDYNKWADLETQHILNLYGHVVK